MPRSFQKSILAPHRGAGSYRLSPDGSNSATAAALLSLVSFVGGFSTNSMWKLLDRNVRRLLGDDDTMVKEHAAAPSGVVEAIKKA